MSRSPIDWKRIENFVGFGRVDAPVVFIGLEEGLQDANGLDEDLAIRSDYQVPIMDLMAAHDGVAGTLHYFDPDRAPRRPTWRVMANLMPSWRDVGPFSVARTGATRIVLAPHFSGRGFNTDLELERLAATALSKF